MCDYSCCTGATHINEGRFWGPVAIVTAAAAVSGVAVPAAAAADTDVTRAHKCLRSHKGFLITVTGTVQCDPMRHHLRGHRRYLCLMWLYSLL